MTKKRILTVFGTCPEAIKMAPGQHLRYTCGILQGLKPVLTELRI